jgi:hypothetical protein
MKSLRALDQFVEHWQDSPSFLVDPYGNATFRAFVRYSARSESKGHLTVVRIRRHGHDKGRVYIQQDPGLFSGASPVDFFPPWQDYAYESDEHALMVHGSSPKIGGTYVVAITPG